MAENQRDVLYGRGGAGEPVTGPVLVSYDAFSPRYDLDRSTGRISRDEHDLAGESIAGKILIFAAPKGGVAAGWALYTLRAHDIAPRALLFVRVNPVFVQGAVHAGIPIVHGFDSHPGDTVRHGDIVRIEPQCARLTVVERRAEEHQQ